MRSKGTLYENGRYWWCQFYRGGKAIRWSSGLEIAPEKGGQKAAAKNKREAREALDKRVQTYHDGVVPSRNLRVRYPVTCPRANGPLLDLVPHGPARPRHEPSSEGRTEGLHADD